MNFKNLLQGAIFLLLATALLYSCKHSGKPHVLVFTKTKGWHHESIPSGIAAMQKLGAENSFDVDTTKDASLFTDDNLKNYSAVIFLSTTRNVLNVEQQAAFERFIQAGGGFVGIHAAADTEYDWPWYNKLVGAYFLSHPGNPNVRKATVNIVDTTHLSTKGLPLTWERTDEWYNYKDINPDIKVLATLDEKSYEGGENGEFHPIAWYHEYDGGRAFYTGGGHTNESYSEPLFLKHVLGGIQYAIGKNVELDYKKAYAVTTPEDNRFTKTILSNDLNEPMELSVAVDGRVFFIERSGSFYMFDPTTNKTKLIRKFPILPELKELHGNGLLGITLDPAFSENGFIYFYYTPDKQPVTQYVSRFTLTKDNMLDVASEKVILQVPIELESSAHTGGSLAWDKNGNLFISTGDNTVPFASEGFNPIDERPGRLTFDAQRSAGNPNDLRGKILRVHLNADGSYTIPEGNLFTKGTPLTRPEIYAMGCRNPYRMSVDSKTSIVYWGEIGPDSGVDGPQGPRGYDEVNQAKQAGNFGWPYFVGDSKPYHHYNFETKEVGDLFEASAPVNNSVNNKGAKNLPPAQKPIIWYPYSKSDEFPELGTGGRCIMAGPVYHYSADAKSEMKLPEYYDKALFIYDWMRNWVFAVRLDENQNFVRMEPFMATNGNFKRPIDMELRADGVLYMLEYGSIYGIDNDDARLVRIEYNGGNRAPIAKIEAKDTIGIAPMKVVFNNKSYDFDDDKLTYEWQFGDGTATASQLSPEHTFEKNGIYKTILKVTDTNGAASVDTLQINVGNTLPQVNIESTENTSFFFNNSSLHYTVQVNDKEDNEIDNTRLKVTFTYLPKVNKELMGHQAITSYNSGKSLMEKSDCKACHQIDKKSVGPAFIEVSKKYYGDKNQIARLANKVITGGGGVWGEHAMNAHPQLSKEDATEIVKYVISLSNHDQEVTLPPAGSVTFSQHPTTGATGLYILNASYTDKGGAITPMTNNATLILRNSKVFGGDADELKAIQRYGTSLGSIHQGSYFVLRKIDLKGIRQIRYKYSSKDIGAALEIHVNAADGPIVSTLDYEPTGNWDTYKEVSAKVKDPGGINDLYFVFKKEQTPNQNIFNLDWLEFQR